MGRSSEWIVAVGRFPFDVHVMATYIGPKNLRLKLCFGNIAYNFYIEIIVIIIKKFFLGTSLLSQSWHSIFIKFVILLLIIKTKGVWANVPSGDGSNLSLPQIQDQTTDPLITATSH